LAHRFPYVAAAVYNVMNNNRFAQDLIDDSIIFNDNLAAQHFAEAFKFRWSMATLGDF
jgi:hypothetical protein